MILKPQEIIEKSLNEYKLGLSKGKRDEVIKYLDYYSGTETQKYIKRYFDSDAFQEIPQYSANITKKFINKMSRLYTVGAKRNVSKSYDKLTEKKNFKMKHIEKMTKLLGSIAVGVFYEKHDTKQHFHYVPVYYFMPFFVIRADKDLNILDFNLLIIIIITFDIFSYFIGSAIGKTKLINISPKKTLEGLIGGIIASSLFAIIFSYYFGILINIL